MMWVAVGWANRQRRLAQYTDVHIIRDAAGRPQERDKGKYFDHINCEALAKQ